MDIRSKVEKIFLKGFFEDFFQNNIIYTFKIDYLLFKDNIDYLLEFFSVEEKNEYFQDKCNINIKKLIAYGLLKMLIMNILKLPSYKVKFFKDHYGKLFVKCDKPFFLIFLIAQR